MNGDSHSTRKLSIDCTHAHHHTHNHASEPIVNDMEIIDLDEFDIDTQAQRKRDRRKLTIAVILCLIFFGIELAGGLVSGSLAILSDSFHLLSDVVSFIISLAAIIISGWKNSNKYTFGYHRAETIGAFMSILMIYILTGVLVYEAIERAKNPEPINGLIMFVIALVGVVVNIVLGLTLHDFHGGHSHSHEECGDSSAPAISADGYTQVSSMSTPETKVQTLASPHGHDRSHGHNHQNLNVRAALIHILGDLISSVGVLVASIFIMVEDYHHNNHDGSDKPYENRYLIVDPICTFFFSVLVLFTTMPLIRDCVNVLMESSPRGFNVDELKSTITHSIPQVTAVSDVKCWNLAMNMPAIIINVVLSVSDDRPFSLESDSHNILDPMWSARDSPNLYSESFSSPPPTIFNAPSSGPSLLPDPAYYTQQHEHDDERTQPVTMSRIHSHTGEIDGLKLMQTHVQVTEQLQILLWRKYRIGRDRSFITIAYK